MICGGGCGAFIGDMGNLSGIRGFWHAELQGCWRECGMLKGKVELMGK